jgi:hypothetical protein
VGTYPKRATWKTSASLAAGGGQADLPWASGAFNPGKRAKSVETNKFTPFEGAVKGGK